MSNEFIGREVEFAIAIESERGVAETVGQKAIKRTTINLIPKVLRAKDDSADGSLEDSGKERIVRKWSEGKLDGIVHADEIGYYFYNLYGAVSSNTVSGATTHDFSMEQSTAHPSLTGFIKEASVDQRAVAGMMIKSLELTATTDDFVRQTIEFIGKESFDDSSILPTVGTEYDFISRDITVKIASSEAGLSSATALKLKSLNLTFDSKTDAEYVFNSYYPDEIFNKKMSISGKFTKNYNDTTFQDLNNGDVPIYMQLTIHGEAVIGTGSANPKIVILLNEVYINDWNETTGGDEIVDEEVSFMAIKNTSDGEQSTISLVNLTAEYAISA